MEDVFDVGWAPTTSHLFPETRCPLPRIPQWHQPNPCPSLVFNMLLISPSPQSNFSWSISQDYSMIKRNENVSRSQTEKFATQSKGFTLIISFNIRSLSCNLSHHWLNLLRHSVLLFWTIEYINSKRFVQRDCLDLLYVPWNDSIRYL